MRTRLFVLGVAVTMFLASAFSYSQTCNNHNATATITDTGGIVWSNATYKVAYYNPSGTTPPVCRSTGIPITVNYSGTLNASGQLTQSLPDTSSVDPNGQWIFTIQSNTSGAPIVMRPITLTADTSFTTSFSAQAIAPTFACIGGCFGYNTNEVIAPVNGQIFTNVTPSASPVCNVRTNGAWVGCGSGGSTNLILTTLGTSGNATLSGNTLNIPNYTVTFAGDLGGTVSLQTVLGLNGHTLPSFSGALGSLYYDGTSLSFNGVFKPLTGSDPPSAGLCTAINVGQVYLAGATLPNVGTTSYRCTRVTGPSYIWVSDNVYAWNFVVPTNQPSANGQACVSSGGGNACTWQSISTSSPITNICSLVTLTNATCTSNKIVFSTSASVVTIANIPQTGVRLNASCNLITASTASNADQLNLTINGDTGSNHYLYAGWQTASNGQSLLNFTGSFLGYEISNSSTGPQAPGDIEFSINDYSNATYGNRIFPFKDSWTGTAAGNGEVNWDTTAAWRPTGTQAVTSFTFTTNSGSNYASGSMCYMTISQ